MTQIRPFADVLRDLDRGRAADEAAVALTDLVQQVIATGKKGRVTIHVEVEPFKGSTEQLMLSARVDSRLPQAEPAAGIFFPDPSGNLHRNNPRQEPLPGLRDTDIARADAELRHTR